MNEGVIQMHNHRLNTIYFQIIHFLDGLKEDNHFNEY